MRLSRCGPVLPVQNYQRPFAKAKILSMTDVTLDGQLLTNVAQWFPNVKKLFLDDISFDDEFVEVCLPQLERIHIDPGRVACNQFFLNGSMKLLYANQKLQTLLLDVKNMPLITVVDIIKENSSLRTLIILDGEELPTILDMNTVTRFANEHPLITDLRLWPYVIKSTMLFLSFASSNHCNISDLLSMIKLDTIVCWFY